MGGLSGRDGRTLRLSQQRSAENKGVLTYRRTSAVLLKGWRPTPTHTGVVRKQPAQGHPVPRTACCASRKRPALPSSAKIHYATAAETVQRSSRRAMPIRRYVPICLYWLAASS